MRHGSLFSGIGGFDLAAHWMGWSNEFHCEFNEFGRKVLNYYWPKAKSYEDITKTDFTIYRGEIDIITGGFPCQPYSHAGKRLGKEDDRHLWPEMLRAIREIQPRWIVGENVSGIVSWNEGMVFEEVQAEMEAEGYKVQSVILPACAVNAPHKRDRVWFIAYNNNGDRKKERFQTGREKHVYGFEGERDVADTDDERLQGSKEQGGFRKSEQSRKKQSTRLFQSTFENFPTESPIRSGDDGLPAELDGITLSKWRNESVKAYGNAIVPQVAMQIFKTIEEYEQVHN